MKLYHGSNMAFERVDLSVCRPNKDFGQGFYHSPRWPQCTVPTLF